jgi:PHD/YefM family antitoxin component YafN of YafNO toxin-antitoxin module
MNANEWVISATDLQTDLVTVLQKAQQHPLLVLDDGKPQAYLVSVDAFDTWMEALAAMEEAEFAANIALGEDQFSRGEFMTLTDAQTLLETRWQQLSPP